MIFRTALSGSISKLLEQGFSPFSNEMDYFLMLKGDIIGVEFAPSSIVKEKIIIRGKLEGIDDTGTLLLKSSRGEICKIREGRVLGMIKTNGSISPYCDR